MDEDSSQPGTPAGGPLQAITQDRVNQQRDSISSVHDKISQFNSMGIVMQSKQLERRTADAALKRAMLGREEAEAELRKLREETRSLHKAVEEGKERERRVGERLETVMVGINSTPSVSSPYHLCRRHGGPVLTRTVCRKTTAAPRRRTHTPRLCGRRRYAGLERRRLRRSP